MCLNLAIKLLTEATEKNIYSSFDLAWGKYEAQLHDCKVVLCGFSPYAKNLVNSFLERGIKNIQIVDTLVEHGTVYNGIKIENVRILDNCDSDTLCIICSNPYFGYYANILRGFEKVISYHLLSICEKSYDYPLERYKSGVTKERINFMIENKEFFINFLNNLADEQSEDIMSKWILYHLTLCVEYGDVKSITPAYFGQDIIQAENYRVFLDLGGYNGDTLRDFLKQEMHYDKYYFFEPDEDLFKEAIRSVSELTPPPRSIVFNNMAIGKHVQKGRFIKTDDMSQTGMLSDIGETEVYINTIDNILLEEQPFTAIKMDIEGAESDALIGGKHTISKYKPALMVSIEHKHDDFKVLPSLILQFCGQYKFYLRCCTDSLFTDLTIYAIV